MLKKFSLAIYLLLGLSILYLGLTLYLPVVNNNQSLYHLSNSSSHILQLVLALPLVFIWLAAFYGYTKLYQYADSLKDAKEATGYRYLARGCMWLAWGKPVVSLITLLLNSLAFYHIHLLSPTTIVINYLAILVPLVAFSYIALGSRALLANAKLSLSRAVTRLLIVLFIGLGILYCYLLFRPVNLTSMTASSSPYYLPVWLVITTIVLPYLYIWLIGLLAVGEFIRYSQKTHGLIYKQAVQFISIGMIAIIASSIALQYVSSINPAIEQMSLDYLLISNYLIRLVGAIGFIVIAIGAIKLKRIEEV